MNKELLERQKGLVARLQSLLHDAMSCYDEKRIAAISEALNHATAALANLEAIASTTSGC